jgi:hypothetical protein
MGIALRYCRRYRSHQGGYAGVKQGKVEGFPDAVEGKACVGVSSGLEYE